MFWARKFQGATGSASAFGWETKPLGEESGNYILANTTEINDLGPKRSGVIQQYRSSKLRTPPIRSGSDVVGAATMPPVGE